MEFSKNFKTGRSPDFETVFLEKREVFLKKSLRWAGHPILRPFLRKAWSFLRILGGACHPILRPFLRKAWSFLRILRGAGHLMLKPFLRKAWGFLRILRGAGHLILRLFFLKKRGVFFKKKFKVGRSPDIETVP
jgi:hypothetical protein